MKTFLAPLVAVGTGAQLGELCTAGRRGLVAALLVTAGLRGYDVERCVFYVQTTRALLKVVRADAVAR